MAAATSKERGKAAYRARIGELVMRWNTVEQYSKMILGIVAGYDLKHVQRYRFDILMADANNVSVISNLRIMVTAFEKNPFHTHIIHFCDCVDILRDYRNYYLHGIMHIAKRGKRQVGVISTVAKQKATLVERFELVSKSDLDDLLTHLFAVLAFGETILVNMFGPIPKNRNIDSYLRERRPPHFKRLKRNSSAIADHVMQWPTSSKDIYEAVSNEL